MCYYLPYTVCMLDIIKSIIFKLQARVAIRKSIFGKYYLVCPDEVGKINLLVLSSIESLMAT